MHQKRYGIKCTYNNAYTLVVPSLHISFPWDSTWLEKRKIGDITNNIPPEEKYIFGLNNDESKIMANILFDMYHTALDWAYDMLTYKYLNGRLDKIYLPKVGKLDITTKYYNNNYVNKPASKGGSPIGTIFPFFHYPTSEHHWAGRLWEHIHLQVPLRCSDDGYSHRDLESYRNTQQWKGLQFMENNITGVNNNNIDGDNSGKSFEYTFKKITQNIKDKDFPKNLNYSYINNIVPFKINKTLDINLVHMTNSSILDKVITQYDKDTDFNLIMIPQHSVFYRGYHSTDKNDPNFKNCKMIKNNNDPNNQFSDRNSWYSSFETAISYAVRHNINKYRKLIPNIDLLLINNPLQLQKIILELDIGFIKSYKTTRNMIFLDLINKHNLEKVIQTFDRINRQRNDIESYINFPSHIKHDILIEHDNFKNNNEEIKDLSNMRKALRITTGLYSNFSEQKTHIFTTESKKLSLEPYFISRKEGKLKIRYSLEIPGAKNQIISHLTNDLNRFSAMNDDENMVKLLKYVIKDHHSSISDQNYNTDNLVKIEGYIGRSCPSLGTKSGFFHSELCVFSNLDKKVNSESIYENNGNKKVLLTENDTDPFSTCPNNENLNKLIKIITLYLFTYKYNINICNTDDEINDNDIFTNDCLDVIAKIKNNDISIINYNKKYSKCNKLLIQPDILDYLK